VIRNGPRYCQPWTAAMPTQKNASKFFAGVFFSDYRDFAVVMDSLFDND
jgi:hypothetical protein